MRKVIKGPGPSITYRGVVRLGTRREKKEPRVTTVYPTKLKKSKPTE